MIDQKLIDRINELAKLSKERQLTDEELVEQFNSYIDHYLKANNYSVFTTANNQPVLNLRLLLENLINGKVFTESQIINFVKHNNFENLLFYQ